MNQSIVLSQIITVQKIQIRVGVNWKAETWSLRRPMQMGKILAPPEAKLNVETARLSNDETSFLVFFVKDQVEVSAYFNSPAEQHNQVNQQMESITKSCKSNPSI